MEMSRISTAFTSSPTASRLLPYSRVGNTGGATGSPRRSMRSDDRAYVSTDGSVLAGGQSSRCLVLVEGAVDRGVGLVDLLAGQHILDDRGHLVAEERVALHDVVELALRERGQAIVRSIDGDDLDVRARLEAGGLDRVKSTEAHVVVLGEQQVDRLAVLLQEALHDGLAVSAGEVAGLRVERLDARRAD